MEGEGMQNRTDMTKIKRYIMRRYLNAHNYPDSEKLY